MVPPKIWLMLWLFLMHLQRHTGNTVAEQMEQEGVCQPGENSHDPTCQASSTTTTTTTSSTVGSLRPSDLPGPVVFTDFVRNTTVTLDSNGKTIQVAEGKVNQINQIQDAGSSRDETTSATTTYSTEFSILPQIVNRSSVRDVLELLEDYQYLDEDPDTVDGMPTYEIFVDSPDLYSKHSTTKVRDQDPTFVPDRQALRDKLQSILQPYLQEIITPFVRQRYPKVCHATTHRYCTPCYSLIRRYRHGDRVSHATHHDGHALVTVVVSLSDYDRDYRGGLYVSTGFGQREFLALYQGDAVVHRSTLLHGVQVYDVLDDAKNNISESIRNHGADITTTRTAAERTHRWSWILWFRDSTECQDYSYEWFADCAQNGDALCQQLHSTKVTSVPGISQQDASRQVLDLNKKAAQGGAGMSAVKVARAYLKQLPSQLPFSAEDAARYYTMAIRSHNPDGHYGMAELLLQVVTMELLHQQEQSSSPLDTSKIYKDARVVQAVEHLESAALLDHTFSKFNLGMVHTYGYATGVVNGTLAGEWFEASGLPEGYYLAAQQAKAIQNQERYQRCSQRAQKLGFTASWRKQARQATGSGGAAGVSLNLPWPPAMDGRKPPEL